MNELSNWLESIGVSPLLAGFVLGGLLVWLLMRRPGQADVLGLANGNRSVHAVTLENGRIHLEHQGQMIDIPPALAAEIIQLLHNRQKIAAIKRLREVSGLGLAEAKNVVELLEKTGR